MKWIELSVEVHPEAVDAVANVFQERVPGGVAIEQSLAASGFGGAPLTEPSSAGINLDGDEPPVPSGYPIVKAYLPRNAQAPDVERSIEQALWHLAAFDLSPLSDLKRREVEEEDWADGWKTHFHPLKIGRVVIKPSWREWTASADEIVVELDPGMAFGTGLHPTTKLMLQALQDYVRPSMRVLDLGTGSGILAIAAAKMGAFVTAVDISDVAVGVAQENVDRNSVAKSVTLHEGTIQNVSESEFELIFANIIASVLIDIASPLHGRMAPGAMVLASGIIEGRVAEVRSAFEKAGLAVAAEHRDEDWFLLAARRPA